MVNLSKLSNDGTHWTDLTYRGFNYCYKNQNKAADIYERQKKLFQIMLCGVWGSIPTGSHMKKCWSSL